MNRRSTNPGRPCLMALLLAACPKATAQPQEPPKPAPLPWGYLSDPQARPQSVFDALFGGKVHLNDRLRVELADTTGRRSAAAVTNRIRLGYETKPFHGLSAMIEMENVAAVDSDGYFVPATGDGDPTRTVIADPTGTEVNQAYARYHATSLAGSGVSLDVRAGRQRVALDDQRFIGNVGWRQFEQTLDAVSLRSDLGVERLSVFYAYVWRIQRIFGPDGPNWESDSHLINASYQFCPSLTVTPFAYLQDFKSDAPAASVASYGVRLSGAADAKQFGHEDLSLAYDLTYAHQSDYGDNPASYDAEFFAAQAKLTRRATASVTVGYQWLGSDGGAAAFQFPLGTNHAFQGFADQFLTTPAFGLHDLYVSIAAEAPLGLTPALTWHQFWSDVGEIDLGYELDAVVAKKFNANWSALVKAAYFDGHGGQPDTFRFWLETTLSF